MIGTCGGMIISLVDFGVSSLGSSAGQGHCLWVVRKPVNAKPGLNFVNRSIHFALIKKIFFTAFVLCRLRLFRLKTEGQTI